MKKKSPVPEPDDTPDTMADLKIRAEKRLSEKAENQKIPKEPEDLHRLVHDLQVHQAELEIRNEELVRARDEEALRKNGELLYNVFEWANDAILLHTLTTDNAPGRFIGVNLVACHMLGYSRDELLTMGPPDIVPPELHPQLAEIIRRAERNNTFVIESRFRRKDGTMFPVESSVHLVDYDGKKVWISHIRDITERKKVETDLARMNRALRMHSESNRVLVHATDETMLMNEICRLAVEVGGYRMAWIGFAEQDEKKTVRPAAHAGDESGYLMSANVTWADSERGRGPGGTAIRSGQPSIVRNIPRDPSFAPWRDEAMKRGYQSIIALPLISEGRTFGALGIYAGEADAFDTEEVEILRELTDDLAFGLIMLRIRAKRDLMEEALRENEEQFRCMTERISDIIMLTDEKGRTTYISPSVKRILGFDPGEILGRGPEDFIHPDDLEIVYEHVNRSPDRQSGEARIEARIRKKDGSYASMEFTGTPILKDGIFSTMQIIARDITERKKAEDALRESEERYRHVVDNTDTGFVVIDDQGIVIVANEPYLRLMGAEKKEEVIGHSVIEWTAPEEQDSNAAAVALCSRQGFIQDFETIYLHRDGTHIHIIINATTHETPGGKRIVSFCRNITERKNMEEALKESETRYRTLAESSPDNIFIIGRDDTIQFVNSRAAENLHLPKDKILGKPRKFFFPPDIAEKQGMSLQNIFETGEPLRKEEIILFGNQEFWLDNALVPLKDETGNVTAVLGLSRDITERKLIEEALNESEQRYRSLFENANEGILFADIKTMKFVHANPAICRMLGYSNEELMAMSVADIHPKESLDHIYQEFRKLVTGERGGITDIPCKKKDGTIRMMDIASSRVMMKGRMYLGGLFTDVTERRQAEEALAESHAQYRQLVENISDVILTLDLKGTVTYISPVVRQLFGYTVQEVVGRHFKQFLHPEDVLRVLEGFRRRVEGEYGANEFRLLTKNGRERYVRTTQTPIMKEGVVTGFNYVMTDITGRRKAEAQVTYQASLLAQVNDAIVASDDQYRLTAWNATAEAMYGWKAEEVLGQFGLDITRTEWVGRNADDMRRKMAEMGSWRGEVTQQRKDGTRFPVEISSMALHDESGRITGWVSVNRDITERKRMEEALRESENYVKTVLDSIDVGFVIIDPATHRILDANTIAVNLIGVAKEKIVGSECYRFICPADKGNCPITDLHQTVDDSESILLKAGNEQCPIIKTVIHITLGGKPVLLESFIDITLQKEAEETLKDFNKKLQQGIEEKIAAIRESELRHRLLFESSQDAIMTLEPPDWRFTSGNSASIEMFRAKDEAEFTSKRPWEWSPEFQPDGRPSDERAKEQIEKAIREGSNYFEWTHRRLTGEDFPATVLLTRFEWKGKEILQATVRDISEQKYAEDKIRASLDEKVLLLREIHHRVKNNLQIIISLVNLQMRQIDDERLKQVMAETQNRVRAMSLVHEKLYQSEDISRIDLANYTRFLVSQLFSYYGVDSRQVALDIDIGEIMLGINTAIPLGLIINELASNALKHAFPNGRTGTLSITVREEGRMLYLTIKSDGAGLPADFDWRHAESLGLRLVVSLVEQLDGTIELDRSAGTAFVIAVKEKE